MGFRSSADPVDFGAQSDLIGAPEPMSIATVLTAPNGGYARGCHGLVHHALRSASGADAQAHWHREHPRPSVWR
jgi:hypothetical protein